MCCLLQELAQQTPKPAHIKIELIRVDFGNRVFELYQCSGHLATVFCIFHQSRHRLFEHRALTGDRGLQRLCEATQGTGFLLLFTKIPWFDIPQLIDQLVGLLIDTLLPLRIFSGCGLDDQRGF